MKAPGTLHTPASTPVWRCTLSATPLRLTIVSNILCPTLLERLCATILYYLYAIVIMRTQGPLSHKSPGMSMTSCSTAVGTRQAVQQRHLLTYCMCICMHLRGLDQGCVQLSCVRSASLGVLASLHYVPLSKALFASVCVYARRWQCPGPLTCVTLSLLQCS